jgi:RNA polymerase sigma-70 factor (ECF subfamily)
MLARAAQPRENPYMDTDLALFERWRSGDKQAGEDLFTRHFADIYRFFEYKVGDAADELVQQTFTACVASRDSFRGQSTFRTYLFAIARNQLYSHLRRTSKRPEIDFTTTSLAEIATSAATRLGRVQQIEQLRTALGDLPAEDQLLLELRYWHELDAAALGEVFGADPGTIRVRLLRARRVLADRMTHLGFALPTRQNNDGLASALARAEDRDDP